MTRRRYRSRRSTALPCLVLALGAAGCSTSIGVPEAAPTAVPTAAASSSPGPTDDPGDPLLRIEGELDDLADRIVGGRDEKDIPGLAGLEVDAENATLELYWVGQPPARVRRLIAQPPEGVQVDLHPATYDVGTMVVAADRLFNHYDRFLHTVSPNDDGTGLRVEQTAADAEDGPTPKQLSEFAGMPVLVEITEPPEAVSG